jgi:hypothetical protein
MAAVILGTDPVPDSLRRTAGDDDHATGAIDLGRFSARRRIWPTYDVKSINIDVERRIG